jgi:hypothetical protein
MSFIFFVTFLNVVYASHAEWILHKFFMHRPFLKFTYPFRAHALTHHTVFKADKTYHLSPLRPEDKSTVPMAWWNGPALIAIAIIPDLVASLLTGKWSFLISGTIIFAAYYGAYEYMHWCMHVPQERNIERTGIFFRLNGHHLLHHRYPNKNFNVVLPLADLLLGTLLLRSPVKFPQAIGPAVPNVQPA